MNVERWFTFLTNPAWPRSWDAIGFPLWFAVGVALTLLTLLSYYRHPQATRSRLLVLLTLRLLALLLILLVGLRPSIAIEEEPKQPSLLLVVVDHSESMTIADEFNNQTRWEVTKQVLQRAEPILEKLREERQVQSVLYRFSEQFDEKKDRLDAQTRPDGKATDIGLTLNRLYNKYKNVDEPIRGVLLLSDGTENGNTLSGLSESLRFRDLSCPIYTFKLGQTLTQPNQKDIAIAEIRPDPSPLPTKGRLTLSATVHAPGFVGSKPQAEVWITDLDPETKKPRERRVLRTQVELLKPRDNDLKFVIDESQTPAEKGEMKVRLVIDPENQFPDSSRENNSIETYVSVVKEGVSILVVDRLRLELKYLRMALATEKRFSYHELLLQTDSEAGAVDLNRVNAGSLDDIDKYDVIILGDVSAKRLTNGDAAVLRRIKELVRDRKMGLMMMGGVDSFAGTPNVPGSGDWTQPAYRDLADLLPVQLDENGQLDQLIQMQPTREGLQHFMMRLKDDDRDNEQAWRALNEPKTQLNGANILGSLKPGAIVLARINDPLRGRPLLVGMQYGNGRTLAFGADTTWVWHRLGLPKTREGLEYHKTFWRRVVMWLAQQDQVEGNVVVTPSTRRLPTHEKLTVDIQVIDKNRRSLPRADLRYQIVGPGEKEDPSKFVLASTEAGKPFTFDFDKASRPGEYRIIAIGEGKSASGEEVKGRQEVPFLVFAKSSQELLNPAANHGLMEKIAAETFGESFRADELPEFLERLRSAPQPQSKAAQKLLPDWRRGEQPWFLPGVLVLFVLLLGLEWGLRRFWGMV